MRHSISSFCLVLGVAWGTVVLVGCNDTSTGSSTDGRPTLITTFGVNETPLMSVKSDRDEDAVFEFRLIQNPDNRLVGLKYIGPLGTRVFTPEQLEEGVALNRVSKEVHGIVFTKDVVRLKSKPGFNPVRGGTIELNLLRQYERNPFLADDRRVLEFDVSFNPKRKKWGAYFWRDYRWHRFDGLYFKQHVVEGEAKGIESALLSRGEEEVVFVVTANLFKD